MIALPMFSAFEAHVINVTAQIENALSVDATPINFGTVFPQEYLVKSLDVALSQSFQTENRVDDVQYIIRQKPKCGWTSADGQTLYGGTKSGHVDNRGNITCPESDQNPSADTSAVYGQLPLLCDYLSKHKSPSDQSDNGDTELDAFHRIGSIDDNGTQENFADDKWVWNDVVGKLMKSNGDIIDSWVIDLAVPCFGGNCAQDWANFVASHNNAAVAADYVQDLANEHKVFGCDLWVEVTGVSEK